jgi:hypothetical protein
VFSIQFKHYSRLCTECFATGYSHGLDQRPLSGALHAPGWAETPLGEYTALPQGGAWPQCWAFSLLTFDPETAKGNHQSNKQATKPYILLTKPTTNRAHKSNKTHNAHKNHSSNKTTQNQQPTNPTKPPFLWNIQTSMS